MGVIPDWKIKQLVEKYKMIEPFEENLVSKGVISYGLSSFGYDIRLADEFKIFHNAFNVLVDPKNFDEKSFIDYRGDYVIIPPNSFVLGRSIEYFRMPSNVLGICIGKSTYARCGIIVNITPLEPCYSADTEILTNEGWKFFYELTGSEKVLTLNENFEAEYKPIERIQRYFYTGEMISIKHREFDLLVTPEHKLFIGKYKGYKRKHGIQWFTCKAKDVYGHYDFYFTREVNWKGDDSKLEDWQKSESFLRFLGAYLGDGSSYINKGGHLIKLATVSNQRKREVFRQILTRLAYDFNLKIGESEQGFYFHSKKIFNVINKLGNATSKYIPREFLDLSPKHLKHIWYGLLNSDGTPLTDTYTTTSRKLADDVQELLFKLGYSAIIRSVTSKIRGKELIAYKIRKTKSKKHKIKPYQVFFSHYTGMVYDVTAKDNHVIFVRRNGKPIWSGNCWEGYLVVEISNSTPLPVKVYANEGIAQIVFFEGDACLVDYAKRSGKYQKQTGIITARV